MVPTIRLQLVRVATTCDCQNNVVADALSRLEIEESDQDVVEDSTPLQYTHVSTKEIEEEAFPMPPALTSKCQQKDEKLFKKLLMTNKTDFQQGQT